MKPDERDMLIRVTATVENLKEHQVSMDAKIDHHIELVDTKVQNKVPFPVFKWVVGGVSGVLLVVLTTLFGIALENRQVLIGTNHLLEDHIGFAAIIYEDLTGQPWGKASVLQIEEAKKRVLDLREQREKGE